MITVNASASDQLLHMSKVDLSPLSLSYHWIFSAVSAITSTQGLWKV